MSIQDVVIRLKEEGVIKQEVIKVDELKGGTVSKLSLLHFIDQSKVVVKFNAPTIVQSEAEFLLNYKTIDFLPKVIYVADTFEYLVYSFVEGSTSYPKTNKLEVLKAIVKLLINEYKPVHHASGWGWADEPSKSWKEFLLKRVEEANGVNNPILGMDDYHLVNNLIESVILETEKPFLLHGDCGVHNFIFREGKICGVIDPLPVWGSPVYDLIYAFCSSPDDLTIETISEAAKAITVEDIKGLDKQVLIGLYLRIASCVKHHPIDLPEYLKAWTYWKETVNQK
ncbi:phosphotransferase [Neobacillus sp. D3-1R]|uniref:phosphotransferase n=1 Tax=Neobacillus sp. D3-1R TaxID=3445778 RepID=UPI003FA1659C